MASSKRKTQYLASVTFLAMFRQGRPLYFWTTTCQDIPTKAQAEGRLKPLRDLIHRRGGTFAGVWQKQQRGSYHLHWVTDLYFDVNQLRPWLVQREWGPIMRVERLQASPARWDGEHWRQDTSARDRLIRYLGRYIVRDINHEDGTKAKSFVCDKAIKAGTILFKWCWWESPGAYLFAHGRDLFFELYGRPAAWRDAAHCVRLGVEITDWLSIDPWYEVPSG